MYTHCAATHTVYIPGLTLTRSERLLLKAIEEVNKEICHAVVGMWGEGKVFHRDSSGDKQAGIHTSHRTTQAHTERKDDTRRSLTAAELVHKWRESVHGLMAWLDWSEWVICTPECGFEVCLFWFWRLIRY